jgi:hypothetical protein
MNNFAEINSANNSDKNLLRFLLVYAIILMTIVFAWGAYPEANTFN